MPTRGGQGASAGRTIVQVLAPSVPAQSGYAPDGEPGCGLSGSSAAAAGGGEVPGARCCGVAGALAALAPGSLRASPARFALSPTLPEPFAMSMSSWASSLTLSVPPRLSMSCFALRCKLLKSMEPPDRWCLGHYANVARLVEPGVAHGLWAEKTTPRAC